MWLLRLFVLVYGAQLLHLVVKAYLYIAPLYLDSVSTVSPYCLKVKIVSQKVFFFFSSNLLWSAFQQGHRVFSRFNVGISLSHKHVCHGVCN